MEIRKFLSVNLADTFFDSLKEDYPKFEEWFWKKSVQGEEAIVQYDEEGHLQGFLYTKDESQEVETT